MSIDPYVPTFLVLVALFCTISIVVLAMKGTKYRKQQHRAQASGSQDIAMGNVATENIRRSVDALPMYEEVGVEPPAYRVSEGGGV